MDSVGNIILYFVVAIVMIVSAYKAVTTTKSCVPPLTYFSHC